MDVDEEVAATQLFDASQVPLNDTQLEPPISAASQQAPQVPTQNPVPTATALPSPAASQQTPQVPMQNPDPSPAASQQAPQVPTQNPVPAASQQTPQVPMQS